MRGNGFRDLGGVDSILVAPLITLLVECDPCRVGRHYLDTKEVNGTQRYGGGQGMTAECGTRSGHL